MLAPSPSSARIPFVDMLRGIALAAMAIYHFFWDLEFFGFADLGVTTELHWLAFARTVAASFLAIVGIALVLGHGETIKPRPFLRRLTVIVVAAGAITGLSTFINPKAIIWFGMLHCIAVSSVIGLLFLRLPVIVVIAAGMACIAAPYFLTSSIFNGPHWLWLGLASEIMPSSDYTPLLPWFGYVLFGITLARVISPHRWPLWPPRDAVSKALCLAGRHSLLVYLAHQPLLMGALWLVARAVDRG